MSSHSQCAAFFFSLGVEPYFDIRYPDALSGGELDQLLALGWFRMHQTIFTTSHLQREGLFRVHWLRFELEQLQVHRSHKRLRNRNRQFSAEISPLHHVPAEHEELFARYRACIDFDGAESVAGWLWGDEPHRASIYQTHCLAIRDGGKLIAGGCFDLGNDSAASILHYFDPAYARFSLGRYLMLCTLDYLRGCHYRYYYPGYVVEGDAKMDYKLFLGPEAAHYFDPEIAQWKPLAHLLPTRFQYNFANSRPVFIRSAE